MPFQLGPRRGRYVNIAEDLKVAGSPLSDTELSRLDTFDLLYRSLCALLYNYVPMSGHPGGSVSSGRFVHGILFDAMDYDVGRPDREDADLISYAAGHKALGLYAMWALRNEVLRIGAPELLPEDERDQLRLEDLLGFRRNPVTSTPLFVQHRAKALDGHPTPATPFLRLSTGASGVGVATSIGLALGAKDYYGGDAPVVHIVEGEGGLTPGRVAESLAAAGTARLDNIVLHVDWNQSSIDSDQVCRAGHSTGDYVQWDPVELAYLNDWNVVYVPDGKDFQQIIAAQRRARRLDTGQPTAIVYCTVKGWKYGIEGRASHGAGHGLCSEGFFEAMAPVLTRYDGTLPSCCDREEKRCGSADGDTVVEECFWSALAVIRQALEKDTELTGALATRLREARARLDERSRAPRAKAPQVAAVYEQARQGHDTIPSELVLKPGDATTLRGELGRALGYYNRLSGGSMLVAAADLMGSTSANAVAGGFPEGFYNTESNPDSRMVSIGGICEDAMSGILAGLSTFGRHIGVGASYGAFLAPLGHVAMRLHAIGAQARQATKGDPYKPVILICAHAGLKTGEDGPTHADPQPLQLVQENFPRGTTISLTPWEPQEIWPLLTAALHQRPAALIPFVTRPSERVPDRARAGLASPTDAARGLYLLRAADGKGDGTVVLQGSGVTYAFVERTLPLLAEKGIDLNVYYVASAELFDLLPAEEQRRIFPRERAMEALGITGFTLPTLYRWVLSERGRERSLHPFRKGHFLGSGPAERVMEEAGLDGESQFKAILEYVEDSVRA
jgi:transketolase